WETSVLISMISPRLARAGTLISAAMFPPWGPRNGPQTPMRSGLPGGAVAPLDDRVAFLSVLQAGGEGDDHGGAGGPERAVAQMGDGDHGLGVGQADAGGDGRASRAGTEVKARHVGPWVLLVEHVDGLHVIGLSHRALDADGERDRVAVLGQWRQIELHTAGLDRRRADDLADGLLHRLRRGVRRFDGD